MLQGALNLTSATLKACLVSNNVSSSDNFLSDIDPADIVATSGALTSVTVTTDRQLNADNVVFPSLTGADIQYIVVYVDTGIPSTSMLLMSQFMSFTPAGVNATVTWGSSGVMRITSSGSNTLYQKAIGKFMTGALDLLTSNLKAVLVDTALYTVNLSTHEFLSSIASGARVATSGNLSGKAIVGGAFDCDDLTFPGLTGASIEAVAIYKDTGVEGTSPLIAWLSSGTNLPYTPSGDTSKVIWSSGSNRVFTL